MANKFLIILFICACISPITGQAQINLVKNGGFEQYYTCPYEAQEVKDAKYWNCIDSGYVWPVDTFVGANCSSDYINTCGTPPYASAPTNVVFYQYPRTGNGMFDVWMYDARGDTTSIDDGIRREYLMGRLSSILTAGQSYCVTFYVVMANTAGYAIDHIGAYLDNGSIDTVSNCGFPLTEYTPQVYATSIINDTLNWTKIQGSFIANGMEKYITIGNFFDSAHTDKIVVGTLYGSEYEVDDISVIATGSQAYAGPDVSIGAGDTAYIGVDSNGNGDGMPCYWYVLGSTTPIDSGGRVAVTPTATTSYVVQMDLCGVVTSDTVVVNVWPLGLRNVQMSKYENVEIYPNPTTGSFTIENALFGKLTMTDVLGREVYETVLSSDKQTINIASLQSGVYIVHIVDPVTGVSVVRKVVKD